MSTPDSAPAAAEPPRLPDTPAKATPAPPSQVAEALHKARRTDDPRAISEYLVLRRK